MRKLYGKRRSKATAEGTWEKVDKDGDLALVISSSLLDGQEARLSISSQEIKNSTRAQITGAKP